MNLSEMTKKMLAESLLTLFKTKNLEDIRVGEICENAQISRKTFYNYFRDKYELMSWIMTQKYQSVFKGDNSKTSDYAAAYYQSIIDEKAFYHRLFSDPGISQLLNYFIKFNYDVYEKITKDAYQLDELPYAYSFQIQFFVYGGIYMTREWILSDFPVSPEVFANSLNKQMPQFLKDIFNI